MMAGHRKIPISDHAVGGRLKLRRQIAVVVRELLVRGVFCPGVVVSEVERLLVSFEHVGDRSCQRAQSRGKCRALGEALAAGAWLVHAHPSRTLIAD